MSEPTGCLCQRRNDFTVPDESGRCMVCGEMADQTHHVVLSQVARVDYLADAIVSLRVRAEAAEATVLALTSALQRLVDQIDLVVKSPEYLGAFAMGWIHGGEYRGPHFGIELAEAKAALAGSRPASAQPQEP